LSDRRSLLKFLGLNGAVFAAAPSQLPLPPAASNGQVDRIANELHEAIQGYELDDSHCHASNSGLAEITPREFLFQTSLAAMPRASYFPTGVFQRWRAAVGDEKASLDRQYGIEKKLDEMEFNARESIFIKALTKELAGFLGCAPKFETVIAARNERARGHYPQYISDLFRDVHLTNAMVDTGCCDGLGSNEFQAYAAAIRPCTMRAISRIDTIQNALFRQDLSFDELESQFIANVRSALDGTGNFGFKSWGMKWHQMERLGVVKPHYDSSVAKQSWEEYKSLRGKPADDREQEADRGRTLKEYFLTIALEECMKRDMPMQIHSGDGEAPGVFLRRQNPYNLEEFVRFDRDGVMRMPKIIPIHAGYPLVGQAAWLSHLYTNCYFETSLMSPTIHQGLERRFGEILEAVPMSKILFGSDSWSVPEYNWLAGRWGKRYLSRALAVYVKEGSLTRDEALEGAQMMLYKNNRRVYNLPA
jgi:predicted TIM-barrel fold metal-dependent hydrolase